MESRLFDTGLEIRDALRPGPNLGAWNPTSLFNLIFARLDDIRAAESTWSAVVRGDCGSGLLSLHRETLDKWLWPFCRKTTKHWLSLHAKLLSDSALSDTRRTLRLSSRLKMPDPEAMVTDLGDLYNRGLA
jgi:hypothetical protein